MDKHTRMERCEMPDGTDYHGRCLGYCEECAEKKGITIIDCDCA